MLGKVSHPSWLIEELTKDNHFGFTTSLSEVDITLESRSSGRPLLNGEADVVGVHHGVVMRSFFIFEC